MARIQTPGDTFYRGHEGGFDAEDIVAVADRLDALAGARFAGITTFPALLFDQETRKVLPTPNLTTLNRGRRGAGRRRTPPASRSTRPARPRQRCCRRWLRPAPHKSNPGTGFTAPHRCTPSKICPKTPRSST